MKIIFFAFCILAISFQVKSATITSNAGTGNWNSTTTWVGGVVPGANDSVVIVNGATVNMITSALVYKMTVNTGGIFNLNDQTLTLQGSTIIGGNLYIYGTFNGGSGNVLMTGNFYCTGTFNSGTSTFTFNATDGQGIGGSTIPSFHHLRTTNVSTGVGKGTSLHPTNTIVTGNFIADGTWNRNSSATNHDPTVTFNGTTQLSGAYSFYLNHIVINAGATVNAGAKTIYLYGNWTCNGSFICGTGTLDVRIDTYSSCQPNNQKIAVTDFETNKFFNVYVNKAAGTVGPEALGSNTLGHLYVTNNFIINAGTWDVNGTRQLHVGGNYTVNMSAFFLASAGRVLMRGTSTTSQMLNTRGNNLYKLTIDNTGGGVKLASNVTVTNELVLTDGIVYTRNGALNNELYVSNSDPTLAIPTGYSSTSYVAGNLRRAITTANYVFPVGVSNSIGSYYRPFTFNITNAGTTTNIIVCEDSITNANSYYADWWIKVLPNAGNPVGTMTFNYNLGSDFPVGMNECGVSVSRGTATPVDWNFVLTTSTPAAGGLVSVSTPATFSPYAFILGEPKPMATDQTICSGLTSTLNITSPTGYGTFNWYSAQTAGTTLATSSTSYTTPALTDTTTYWAAHVNSQCAGHRWPYIVNVNPIPTATFNASQPSCNNSCSTVSYTGSASTSATYVWNFSGATATPGTGQGPHQVCYSSSGVSSTSLTVTENGCTSPLYSDNIETPVALAITSTVQNSTCNTANGSIDISVSGGWGSYSYYWSNTQITQDISGLTPGNYDVTITDGGGCTKTGTYSISDLGAPTVNATLLNNTLCNGSHDGEVSFTCSGTGTLTYNWSNGINGQGNPVNITIDTLQAGSYSYTVTDGNSCVTSGAVSVNEPMPVTVSASITQPLCYGQNNGSISLTPSGGTAPYSYNWALGSSQPNQINLAGGNYLVTISDSHNCQTVETYTITPPDSMIIDYLISPISCFGDNNGAINATVTGGTPPYTYSWTGGSTTPNIDSLINGTYVLSVLDDNNCSTMESITLSQPFPLDIIMNPANAPCHGIAGGSVLTNISGGTSPYGFEWDNGATTQNITSLFAGSYWVTVTDDHGCSSVGSTGITEPDTIIVSSSISSLLCYGDSTGVIQLYVSGGIPSFTYNWNIGGSNSYLQDLVAGTYTVTISDANACTVVQSAIISQPLEVIIQETIQNVTCYGTSTGSISVQTQGGTDPYVYEWNTGEFATSLTDLAIGNYQLTVNDNNGCFAYGTYTITQPDSLWFEASFPDLLCWGDSSGSITLTTYGGTSPYTWTWSNGINGNTNTQLIPGNYSCTITDNKGCYLTDTFTLGTTAPLNTTLIADYNTATLLASVTGGSTPYNYSWNNNSVDSMLLQIQSGFYTVTITDNTGCTSEASLTYYLPLEIPTAITPNGDGKNDTWEIKGIAPYNDINIEIFNRWGDKVFTYTGSGLEYSDLTKQWNGTFNNNDMPTGVYLFILNIPEIGDPFQGTITLIR